MNFFRSKDKPKPPVALKPLVQPAADDGLVTKKKPAAADNPKKSVHDMDHDATIIDFDGELSISDDPGSDPYGC